MNIELFDTIVIRTPLLPFKSSFRQEDLELLICDDVFLESIYISSPDLYAKIVQYKQHRGTSKKETKFWESILKYALKIHTRPVPFGYFATCSTAQWDTGHHLEIPAHKEANLHVRPDANLLSLLVAALLKIPGVKYAIRYRFNDSAYYWDGEIRYVNYYYSGSVRRYLLKKIKPDGAILSLWQFCDTYKSYQEITAFLRKKGYSATDVLNYLEELISNHILFAEIETCASGGDQFKYLINTLKASPGISLSMPGLMTTIEKVNELLEAANKNQPGSNLSIYHEINNLFSEILPDKLPKDFLHIDVYRNAPLTVDRVLKNDLLECVIYLSKLNAHRKNQALTSFIKKYTDRYGEKVMPLTHVLDTENGIGYPPPKEAGAGSGQAESLALNQLEIVLIKHFANTENRTKPMHLETLSDLNLEGIKAELPCTFNGMVSLYTENDHSTGVRFHFAGNATATTLFARFSTHDESIRRHLNEICAYEKQASPNHIIADISHISQDRLVNVIHHSNCRDYIIPYLSNYETDDAKVVKVKDLHISVNSNNQEIAIFSPKLKKNIIPTLNNAHNYSINSLPVYHFLADIQYKNAVGAINFTWGNLMEIYQFFPRVYYKKILVSRSMWILRSKDIEHIVQNPEILPTFFGEYPIPTCFNLIEGDHELLIDYSNELSVALFISTIKGKPVVTLAESLSENINNIPIQTNGKGVTNQLIVAFKNRNFQEPSVVSRKNHLRHPETDLHNSDNFIYVKIYTGIRSSEFLLKEIYKKVIKPYFSSTDSWFFIRYKDPEHHIRLRCFIPNSPNQKIIRTELEKLLCKKSQSQIISDYSYHIYNREIERYGAETIAHCEQWFHFDSEYFISILQAYSEDELNENQRIMLALTYMRDVLPLLISDPGQQKEMVTAVRKGFEREFNVDKRTKIKVDLSFRGNSNEMYKYLWNSQTTGKKTRFKYAAYARLSELMVSQSSALLLRQSIAPSLIHMFINRLFETNNRWFEYLVYYYFERLSVSREKREEKR